MKSIFFLLLFLATASTSFLGQKSLVDLFEAHRFLCDSGSTSLEINICSGERLHFADSLMALAYKRLLRSVDEEIAGYQNDLKAKRSIVVKAKNDSIQINAFSKEVARLKKYKQSIVTAQSQWKKSLDTEASVEQSNCEGGTGCVGMVNQFMTDQILNRISRLESLR